MALIIITQTPGLILNDRKKIFLSNNESDRTEETIKAHKRHLKPPVALVISKHVCEVFFCSTLLH